ncbi:TonB-dependent receptor [Pleurocapsales cyanobacterium LEGE 06147]|nr:TonB-dependent receptor [Pleurocapsales cyanobacterium LEGE 06147]
MVTGEQETGYRVERATTATRTDTPILDIPQSIQVVPRQVIEDQRSTSLEEALRNVSGVRPANNNANVSTRQSFVIRGFDQFNLFRNGFPASATPPIDVAGVERVEVLKGPASVLFGQVEPGGIINVISKRPLSEPYYSFEGQIGSYEFYRPTLDFSGPLTEDGRLLYRLNATYTNADSFRDFVERESFYIAPVITYQFSERTSITFDLDAYTDAEITEDNSGFEGLRPTNTPEHAGSLWLTYEFQQGSLEGLGLGAGIFASSRIEGSDGTYFLPGYTTVDLATWYGFSAGASDVRLQLNVKNLFDMDVWTRRGDRPKCQNCPRTNQNRSTMATP